MLKCTRMCYWGLVFAIYVSSAFGILKQEESSLKADVMSRLASLQQFIPQEHYRWHMHWIDQGLRRYGSLEGIQQGKNHWITITFLPDKTLIFNKINPRIALYPNKLCLYLPEAFTAPLPDLPGVCIHMIAMPFLNWDIADYSKTAKLGRRVIRVLFAKNNLRAEVFLDKYFNTILQAKSWDTQSDFCAGFTLKHLKKFKSGWGPQSVEFTYNKHKTLLYVDDVEALK